MFAHLGPNLQLPCKINPWLFVSNLLCTVTQERSQGDEIYRVRGVCVCGEGKIGTGF